MNSLDGTPPNIETLMVWLSLNLTNLRLSLTKKTTQTWLLSNIYKIRSTTYLSKIIWSGNKEPNNTSTKQGTRILDTFMLVPPTQNKRIKFKGLWQIQELKKEEDIAEAFYVYFVNL